MAGTIFPIKFLQSKLTFNFLWHCGILSVQYSEVLLKKKNRQFKILQGSTSKYIFLDPILSPLPYFQKLNKLISSVCSRERLGCVGKRTLSPVQIWYWLILSLKQKKGGRKGGWGKDNLVPAAFSLFRLWEARDR